MIKLYEAFIDAGASKESASSATEEVEKVVSRVDRLEVKINVLIGLALVIVGMLGGVYLTLFNISSRLPR